MLQNRWAADGLERSLARGALQFGALEVNRRCYCVELAGVRLPLTRVEFDLFERLVLSAGRVVPYRELADSVLRGQFVSESATLRVHVSHLRRKLGVARDCLVTVRGRGLAFDATALERSPPAVAEIGAAS